MTPPSIDPEHIHRTSSSRFENLPDFSYQPNYDHWGNLRYAFIDEIGPVIDLKTGNAIEHAEGSIQTETVICLHGEPTWSYLYRKMIPGFLNDISPRKHRPESRRFIQRRVVAPDFIGFGRSDKVIDDDWYTWDNHRSWLVSFIQKHIVEDSRTAQGGRVVLVVQDWGGLLGLTLPLNFPSLFTHLLVMNTGLGVGKLPSKGWQMFRDFVARSPDLDVGGLISRGTPLSKEEINAYRAPFPNKESKAGVRRFPQLVPVDPNMRGVPDSIAALSFYQSIPKIAFESNSLRKASAPQSQGIDGNGIGSPLEVFVAVGAADPVLGEPVMQSLAYNAFGKSTGYWWHVIEEGGHFVQEWGKHLPGLSDKVWSRPTEKGMIIKREEFKAEWIEPERSNKL